MSQYDFVVVGGGPAGAVVASRLARSSKRPSVLLIEAGGKNDDKSLKVDSERWGSFMNTDLNWNYHTPPQKHAKGRAINYSRGKGLGGSTAINFACYDIGPKDDFEEWANLVGDDTWRWEHSLQRYRSLETYHGEVPANIQKYLNPIAEHHGDNGPLDIGFPFVWERDLPMNMDLFEEYGLPLNPDINSGNPLGMALCPNTALKGQRTTAAAFLEKAPNNLTVLTDTVIDKIILEDKVAVGVEAEGKQFFASKDVILSAGSLDTPKILMLSGIGPKTELQKHSIGLVHELPRVGKGLRDHYGLSMHYLVKDEYNDRGAYYRDPEKVKAAKEQWMKDGTGELSTFACQVGMGFFKSDKIYASEEFKALPKETQSFLQRPTIPCFEIACNTPSAIDMQPSPGHTGASFWVMTQNQQVQGEVTLASANPKDLLIADPHMLEHPYDRRVMIEGVKMMLDIIEKTRISQAIIQPIVAPKSSSDKDVLDWIEDNVISIWHMTGTVKMGRVGDPNACVDPSFRVNGLKNLRVVDMSVVPILPNCHTQSTAYLVGAVAGDKLVAEYNLD